MSSPQPQERHQGGGVSTCLVCEAAIWSPSEQHLCHIHRGVREQLAQYQPLVRLQQAITWGATTDFDAPGRRANHRAMQTMDRAITKIVVEHWVITVGDVLRRLRYWL